MDPVTHAALGAITGELLLGRQLGKRALAWGALFGMLPDIDAVFALLLDTAHGLALHRGFFHSLFFIALLAVGLARPLAKRWAKEGVTPLRAGGMIALAMGSHLLVDLFSVYGAQPFEPFSGLRVSFDNLFIIDVVFTIPLLVAVGIALCKKPVKPPVKKPRSRKKVPPPPVPMAKYPWWCLGISCAYVGLSFWAKSVAAADFEHDLARRGVTWKQRMESPTPLNIFFWRGLVERDGEIWLGYRSIFDAKTTPVSWTIIPKGEELAKPFEEEREVKTVEWFSKGWWIARPAADGLWMADLRFEEMRDWDKRGVALRPEFAWTFGPAKEGNRLRRHERGPMDAGETARRMGRRIAGETTAWDGNPRLVGPFLAIQEYLSLKEAP
ncbi:MAG: hypothetical protein JWO82_3413 [Akkermansiaceae bacterium]|nr:hypothetical protein [Akkermansiaceae bacterium]